MRWLPGLAVVLLVGCAAPEGLPCPGPGCASSPGPPCDTAAPSLENATWEHVRLRAEVERMGDAHVLHAWVDNGCAQPITLLGTWTPDEKVRDRILDPAGQPVPRLLVGAWDPKLHVVAPATTLEDQRRWDGRVSAGNGRSEPAAPGTYTWQVEALVHLGARTLGDTGWDADRHTLRAEVRFSV